MKNALKSILCLFSFFLPPVYAVSDASLSISANIVASPCDVNKDTVDGKVDLGHFYTNQLSKAGDATQWVTFYVELNNCPQATTKVTVGFKGDPLPSDPDLFINSGTSKNVAIEVSDNDGQSVSNGSVRILGVDVSHNAKLQLKSRMLTPEGLTTSGSVSGSMEVSFLYQ